MDKAFINIAIVASEEQREKEKALKKPKKEETIRNDNFEKNLNKKQNSHEKSKKDELIKLRARYRAGEGDLGLYEAIYIPKKEIAMYELFYLDKITHKVNLLISLAAKRLLIEGRAGIGKSTLAKFLAYQWSKRKEVTYNIQIQLLRQTLSTQFSGVIWISLRQLNRYTATQEISLANLLCYQKEFNLDKVDMINSIFHNNFQLSQPILYLLDGWDELDSSIWTEGSPRSKLLESLVNKHAWLITSRPGQVPQEIKKEVCLELLGFNTENIVLYIQNFFKNDRFLNDIFLHKLLEFIRKPMIMGMAHIPINLELICCSWRDRYEYLISEEELSLAELYYEIIACLVKRYHDGKNQKKGGTYYVHQVNLAEQLWTAYHNSLFCLQAISFKAMQKKSLFFCLNDPEYKNILLNFQPIQSVKHIDSFNEAIIKFEGLKLLQDSEGEKNFIDSIKQQYYFVHLSFQEFFSACYLFNLLCSIEVIQQNIATEWIAENKYLLRYRVVMAFLVNLLYFSQHTTDRKIRDILGDHNISESDLVYKITFAQEKFWSAITTKKNDFIGIHKIELLVFLSNHVGKKIRTVPMYIKLEKYINQIIDDENYYKWHEEFSLNRIWFERLSNILKYCHINFRDHILSETKRKLLSKNIQEKYHALTILYKLGSTASTPEICSILIDKLITRFGDHNVIYKIINRMGPAFISPQILLTLSSWVQSKDKSKEESAFMSIESIGSVNPDILSILENCLDQEDHKIQTRALVTLKKIGVNATTPKILSILEFFLQGENTDLHINALDSLAYIGSSSITPKILSIVENDIQSENNNIKISALKLLENIGGYSITPNMFPILEKYLEQESECIKIIVLDILESIDSYSITTGILLILEECLEKGGKNVQAKVLKLLKKMGREAITPKIFNFLEKLQRKDDYEDLEECLEKGEGNIQAKLLKLLKKNGIEVITPKIFDFLEKLQCKNHQESDDVVVQAIELIQTIISVTITPEIFSALANQLLTKDEDSLLDTLEILASMGSLSATHEILAILGEYLQSKNEILQMNTLETLIYVGSAAFTPEICLSLIKLLQHKNNSIQVKVFLALKYMNNSSVTPEILTILASYLQTGNIQVQLCILDILQNIGNIAATPEILLQLENMLLKFSVITENQILEILKGMSQVAIVYLLEHYDRRFNSILIKLICLNNTAFLCYDNENEKIQLSFLDSEELFEFNSSHQFISDYTSILLNPSEKFRESEIALLSSTKEINQHDIFHESSLFFSRKVRIYPEGELRSTEEQAIMMIDNAPAVASPSNTLLTHFSPMKNQVGSEDQDCIRHEVLENGNYGYKTLGITHQKTQENEHTSSNKCCLIM